MLKKTFYGMEIIQVSTNNNGFLHEEKAIKRIDLQRVASVSKNKGITIEQYIKGNHLVMTLKKFIPIKELIFDLNLTLENNIYILWEMSFNFPNYNRPGWSGFMQVYRKGALPRKSEVTLLPIINLNPNYYSCIYSTLLLVIGQSKKTNSGPPCITFDQPLWLKAVKIITEKPLHNLCRVGGFHTLMSFLGNNGTSMKGSGFSESMQVVYGKNTVQHIVSGKAIARAFRGNFLLQSALRLQIIRLLQHEEMISEEDLNTLKSLHENFTDGKSHDENIVNCEIIEKLNCALEKLMARPSESLCTAKPWIQCIRYIDIVKYFSASERTGNWQNHLGSTAKMLNLFAATGHSNYAKSARLYLQMMKELPAKFPDL